MNHQVFEKLKNRRLWTALMFVANPLIAFWLMQLAMGFAMWNYSIGIHLANYMVLGTGYFILFALTNKIVLSGICVQAAALAWGIANAYIISFRGTPIQIWDFTSLGTALAVADNYNLMPTVPMVLAVLLFIAITIASVRLTGRRPIRLTKRNWQIRAGAAVLGVLCVFFGLQDEFLEKCGVQSDVWDEAASYQMTGAAASFVLNTKFMDVDVPESYSEERVEELRLQTMAAAGTLSADIDAEIDAQAALEVAAEVASGTLSEDAAAGSDGDVKAVSENSAEDVSEEVLVSDSDDVSEDGMGDASEAVLKCDPEAGSEDGTGDASEEVSGADSEESEAASENESASEKDTDTESDTDSEAAVDTPVNIIVIMNESWADFEDYGNLELSESVMDYIKSLDNTIFGHAYTSVFGAGTSASEFEFLTGNSMAFLPSGSIPYQQYVKSEKYSLASALKELGYSCTAMHPGERTSWQRNEAYPQLGFDDFLCVDDMHVALSNEHDYVGDDSSFNEIIYQYEHRDESKPFFLFNVTIQNHGSYTVEDYEAEVYVADEPGKYPQAEQYLTLANKTDQDFEILVDYFSACDDPTIILMFGDHQPSVETEFLEKAYGVAMDEMTMDDYMGKYKVPFVFWANYDLPDDSIEITSLNFLKQYLMDYAGIEKSNYDEFLTQLSETMPAMTFVGYYGADGHAYSHLEQTEYDALIEDYSVVQYDMLFGDALFQEK